MKSLPEHACEACHDLVNDITDQLRRMQSAKRLGTIEEMQNELAAMQLDLGLLRSRAQQAQVYVTRAFDITHLKTP